MCCSRNQHRGNNIGFNAGNLLYVVAFFFIPDVKSRPSPLDVSLDVPTRHSAGRAILESCPLQARNRPDTPGDCDSVTPAIELEQAVSQPD